MKYVVYCDESRHSGLSNNRYMAIGGLWVPEDQRDAVSREFRRLCRSLGLNSEIKWNKTSNACLDAYKALVDFFFQTPDLHYRVIVVDQVMVNGDDPELSFYKFYYQMLKAWIFSGNRYLVLLDYKRNKNLDRYDDLRRILRRRADIAHATISDLTVIDSARTPLAQLCDLLTGAVAASFCSDVYSAKATLAAHIAAGSGLQSLRYRTLSPAFNKFNIFRINLG